MIKFRYNTAREATLPGGEAVGYLGLVTKSRTKSPKPTRGRAWFFIRARLRAKKRAAEQCKFQELQTNDLRKSVRGFLWVPKGPLLDQDKAFELFKCNSLPQPQSMVRPRRLRIQKKIQDFRKGASLAKAMRKTLDYLIRHKQEVDVSLSAYLRNREMERNTIERIVYEYNTLSKWVILPLRNIDTVRRSQRRLVMELVRTVFDESCRKKDSSGRLYCLSYLIDDHCLPPHSINVSDIIVHGEDAPFHSIGINPDGSRFEVDDKKRPY
jgi:hypothetical protein